MAERCPNCGSMQTECINAGYGDSQEWGCDDCLSTFEVSLQPAKEDKLKMTVEREIHYGKEVEKILERFNRDLLKLRELSLNGREDAFHGIEHMTVSCYRVWEPERIRRKEIDEGRTD